MSLPSPNDPEGSDVPARESASVRFIEPAGPPERRVFYYDPGGSGHGSLEEKADHHRFHDKPLGRWEVQMVVEFVYPWTEVDL